MRYAKEITSRFVQTQRRDSLQGRMKQRITPPKLLFFIAGAVMSLMTYILFGVAMIMLAISRFAPESLIREIRWVAAKRHSASEPVETFQRSFVTSSYRELSLSERDDANPLLAPVHGTMPDGVGVRADH